MSLSHFFIDRPIFAAVLSIVTVILGAISYLALPVAQYPEVVPPTIVVRASYPGASPEVIADTVATPIEQEVNGVEDTKNAVLIVEFAKQQQEAGKDRFAAAVEACRIRLRPILMTAFAFILGVLPLARAVGPGAELRKALGTAVFSGMLGVTAFGLFLTPVFYVLLRRTAEGRYETRPAGQLTPVPPRPQ